MLRINSKVVLAEEELELKAIRAQGAGGQNVNKVSTAIHLRFDIQRSSLPQSYKDRLLKFNDHRISSDGVIVIKAQRYRSQEKNRTEALERLKTLILKATAVEKKRIATKPTTSAKRQRVDSKTQRGKIKALRGKVLD